MKCVHELISHTELCPNGVSPYKHKTETGQIRLHSSQKTFAIILLGLIPFTIEEFHRNLPVLVNSPKIYFHVEFTWLTFRLSFSFRSSISLIFFKRLELRLNVVFYKSSSSYKCRPLINIVVFSFVLYTIKLVGRSLGRYFNLRACLYSVS